MNQKGMLMISSPDILNAKILIVDDLEANIILLTRMLGGAGYTSISSTQNSSEVCELHRKKHYDLIMLDLKMPVMNGFQVMEGLKEIERDGYLPVLVITAQPDQKLRALQAGAKDFIGKPFDRAEVMVRVHNLLEVRLLHKESQRLLLNVLPRTIAERLKGRRSVIVDGFAEVIADSFPDVTVLFADIVEFTKFSQSVSTEQLVILLNEIFTEFDNIADNRGLEKIKTIGDAYMAAAGLPIPAADHVIRAAHMALDMMEALAVFNERKGYDLKMRIGINTGSVVAGVIGKRKFIYDLWGDTVNIASRMESHGVAGQVHLSQATRQILNEPFFFEERGIIDVKGKGNMQTWFLTGRDTADSPGGPKHDN